MSDTLRSLLRVAKRAGLLAWVGDDREHIVVRILLDEDRPEDTPIYNMRELMALLGQ